MSDKNEDSFATRPAPAITDGMVEDIAGIISDECVVEYTPAVTMYESADPQDADYHIVNSHDVAAKIVSALAAALPHAVDAATVYNQAIEGAAKVCDEQEKWHGTLNMAASDLFNKAAHNIRALKNPTATAPEQNDNELPGMWSHSDFEGGDPDTRSYHERKTSAAAIRKEVVEECATTLWPKDKPAPEEPEYCGNKDDYERAVVDWENYCRAKAIRALAEKGV